MENVILEIEHQSEDKSIRYKLIYIVGRKIYGRRRDKTYPKVTQCLVFRNGILQGFNHIIKCDDDVDNFNFSIKTVTKKAITHIDSQDLIGGIWEKIDKKLSQSKQSIDSNVSKQSH